MIIQNAAYTDDGEAFKSWTEHHYVTFKYKDRAYFISGGNECIKTNIDPLSPGVRLICLSELDSVEQVIDVYIAKDNTGRDKFIKDMNAYELERVLEHIKHPLVVQAIAILQNQKHNVIDMLVEEWNNS